MNSRLLISSVVLMAVSLTAFGQTIRRVNNKPGVTGANIYGTAQAAHDAAVDGDIIYVEGSPATYGELKISKSLTFIGAGFFLAENQALPGDKSPSQIEFLEFSPGSTITASLTGIQINGWCDIRSSDVTLSRNYFKQGITIGRGISNIRIEQSFLAHNIQYLDFDQASTVASSNIAIYNNIIRSQASEVIKLPNNFFGIAMVNNTIHNASAGYGFTIINVFNATLSNNLVMNGSLPMNINSYGTFNYSFAPNNNTYNNNVAHDDRFGTASGNVQNVDMSTVFITTGSPDGAWKLKPASPAIGAGLGGIDCGAFGGINPYVLSGTPAYPTINSFITSGSGSSTTPLAVTIDTKSNN